MTNEEAKDILECSAVDSCDLCASNKKYGGDCECENEFYDALSMAIEALEKQTVKSLARIKDARWNYQCVCGCKFMSDNYYEYCPKCGQKLVEGG